MDGPQELCLADVTGSGYLDIFSTNVQTQGISYLQSNGDGTFHGQVLIPVYYNSALASGDFVRSGRPQVFVVFASSSPVVVSRDSMGNFTTTPVSTTLTGHQNCVVVDLNRDGYPDVIAMASSGNQHSVFLNDQHGGFVEYLFTGPVCGGTARASGKLAAADFDGDGRVDVAFGSAVEDSVTIFLNR